MSEKPKVGRNTGNAGKGRPKGVPNKTTTTAKEAIALAAQGLGGAERMIVWAKEDPLNERAFWSSIYPKLIPVQLAGTLEHAVTVTGALAWKPPQ